MSQLGFTETNHESESVIYITGFGPFGRHVRNSSQAIVERLQSTAIESELNIKLYTDVLPVSYESVQNTVPARWKQLQPELVIHIGVSDLASSIALEKQAFNDKYCEIDINGSRPHAKQCVKDNPHALQTQLDLKKAKEVLNSYPSNVKFTVSNDPGRYLCGFVYYTSLNIDNSRSVFIHVPTLKFVSSDAEEATAVLVQAVSSVIKVLYKQVKYRSNEEIHVDKKIAIYDNVDDTKTTRASVPNHTLLSDKLVKILNFKQS